MATAVRHHRAADLQPEDLHPDRRQTAVQRVHHNRRVRDVGRVRSDAVLGQVHHHEDAAVHLRSRNGDYRREYRRLHLNLLFIYFIFTSSYISGSSIGGTYYYNMYKKVLNNIQICFFFYFVWTYRGFYKSHIPRG